MIYMLSDVVIPLLTLIIAILTLILDYVEYRRASEEYQRKENPDKRIKVVNNTDYYVNAEAHPFLEVRGEPPDNEKSKIEDAESKDVKKTQETNTQA